jgi:hypothetical protein
MPKIPKRGPPRFTTLLQCACIISFLFCVLWCSLDTQREPKFFDDYDKLELYRVTEFAGISHALIVSGNETKAKWMMFKTRHVGFKMNIFESVMAGTPEWMKYAHFFRNRDADYGNSNYQINSPAALGLLATWRKIMYRCYYSRSCTNLLIFEDDIYFHNRFESLLIETASSQHALQYDLIYLGANCQPPCNLRDSPDATHEQLMELHDISRGVIAEINTYIPRKDLRCRIYGTFGLLLSRKMIEVLFHELRDLRLVMLPIDNLIEEVYRRDHLKVGICFPFLTIPEVRESSNMGSQELEVFLKDRIHVRSIENYEFMQLFPEMNAIALDPNLRYPRDHLLAELSPFFHQWFLVILVIEEKHELEKALLSLASQDYALYRLIIVSSRISQEEVSSMLSMQHGFIPKWQRYDPETLRLRFPVLTQDFCEASELVIALGRKNVLASTSTLSRIAKSALGTVSSIRTNLILTVGSIDLYVVRKCSSIFGVPLRKILYNDVEFSIKNRFDSTTLAGPR